MQQIDNSQCKKNINLSQSLHIEFLNKALACNGLCLLEHAGICTIINEKGGVSDSEILSFKNPSLIRSALATLIRVGIISYSKKEYRFTEDGIDLYENIGLIYMVMVGYRHLFAKQFDLISEPDKWSLSDIDCSAVASSSENFGHKDLDPKIFEALKKVQPNGTICDLGAGTGDKLYRLCNYFNVGGLGIEKDHTVVKQSKHRFDSSHQIELLEGDITRLEGVWEDVDVATMCMVYHDIVNFDDSVNFLKSLRDNFPRLRYLIVADIVTGSKSHPDSLSAFEYVHGLQGVTPRDYDQTMRSFLEAGYKVVDQISVPNIPNMYVWTITLGN